VATVATRSILTPTGGFLVGFTHTLNPYRGCAFGRALCGVYCYASETRYGKDRAQSWGGYLLAKEGAAELYRAEAAKIRAKGGALRIFMASVTDPYVPQERTLGVTRSILEAMTGFPPDLLVLQTHTPGPLRDRDLLEKLPVVVQITIETDRARIEGLPPHATPLAARLAALRELKASGVKTVAVASPLLPLEDPLRFARTLGASAHGVILDHWALGDGSTNGARTRRERAHAKLPLPRALEAAGFAEWNSLEKFHEVVRVFEGELGADRVGVSQEGFGRACTGWPR
jgi:DNA repair photolyase